MTVRKILLALSEGISREAQVGFNNIERYEYRGPEIDVRGG